MSDSLQNNSSIIDIFIIGGGINGSGIAVDAAGRGLSVVLVEKQDLAAATSSASSKLIHGGLRYLEQYEFRLVREALQEREVLLSKAPHLIHPLEFIVPHAPHLRPYWLIRLGLFLYDHLAFHKHLPGSQAVNLQRDVRGKPLLDTFKRGFSYYDCQVDDSRLVIANALAAQQHGALILPHTECIAAEMQDQHWKITVRNNKSQQESIYLAKALVNASGPWVDIVKKNIIKIATPVHVTLSKGSHIIVPKLYSGQFAYLLQNQDQRIVFAIPYQDNFTLIGTTDTVCTDNLDTITISEAEINYLCATINQYFQHKITAQDIVWSYSGVRPLQSDTANKLSAVTRDYALELIAQNTPPLLNIYGGKITTFRRLAEHALQKLAKFFPRIGPAWTANQTLPGGEFKEKNYSDFYVKFRSDFHWLPEAIADHYAKTYGNRAYNLLTGANNMNDLGIAFGAILHAREVEYLLKQEWAETAEDILWRRTKLGLFMSAKGVANLQAWLTQRSCS